MIEGAASVDYVKIEGLDGLKKRLEAFPVEMAKNGGPIRAALAKGAKIIREAAKANVRAIIAEPNVDGLDRLSTGLLEKSIIQKRARDPRSKGATEIYSVRVRRATRKPRGKEKEGVSVTRYGKILEFGSDHGIKPYAWLRNAAEQNRMTVFAVVANELAKGIAKVERKLGAGK